MDRQDVFVDAETLVPVMGSNAFGSASVDWRPANKWQPDGENWIDTGEQKTGPDGTPLWIASVIGYDGRGRPTNLRLHCASPENPNQY